jgi:hypothetical protein
MNQETRKKENKKTMKKRVAVKVKEMELLVTFMVTFE